MNILAVGAHFDDIELGCGGTLAKHVKAGDNVIVFIATDSQFRNRSGEILRDGKTALEEAKEAASIIGYKLVLGGIPTFELEYGEAVHAKLLQIIEENKIELIYTHWCHDVHHDHRNLSYCTMHVSRHVNKLLMYRSNWYVSEKEFCGNFFVDITETWETKERAVKSYKTEMGRTGGSWLTWFRQDAVNNGLKMGVEYAEIFQLVKWLA